VQRPARANRRRPSGRGVGTRAQERKIDLAVVSCGPEEIAMVARRAYWKGYLKLSLVTCPVALYPASTQSEKTRFHQINRKTGNRLRQQMVDEDTGRVVDKESKGRGYELAKGEYVEIEPEELKAVEIESTHTIDIDKFVPEEEIDKRYYERPYYIVPDGKSGEEAFAVIRDAMKDEGRIALARIVFANREHILAIEPWGKGLLGTTLRYDHEVRDEKDFFKGIPSPRVSKEMVDLARHILAKKAGRFDAAQFKDEYELALRKLVKRKAAGKTIERPEAEESGSNVVDLMDALRQSLKGRRSAALRSSTHSRKSKPAARRRKGRVRKAG
jgi:DNA end-binding protein Ku